MGWNRKNTGMRSSFWEPLDEIEEAWIHPREFYMTSEEKFGQAIEDIETELDQR